MSRESKATKEEIQRNRDEAYQNGWSDGYAEGYGKATEAAEAKIKEMALDVLAASGQAHEAYQAQLAAEATVATLTAQVEALMKAAKKVVTSHWQSTDGTISGMYELERALAVLAEIAGGKKDE